MKKIISFLFFVTLGVIALAQKITVTGVVLDDSGQPAISAAVIDKSDTKNGVVTDFNGKYSIQVDRNAVLEFSYVGCKSKLENVAGRAVINVQLELDQNILEEAVLIGYGTSKKGDLTGSVAVVDMEDIRDTPVSSVAQALQGRVSGMDIVTGSGEPGESTSIQIRGARSISAGNEPLIVVDGVVDAVSSLDDINPADIVNISVLKDVSSTAIYGSRGANGVILISTSNKPDKDGSLKFMFMSNTGISRIAGKLDLMDASEYATWYNMYRVATSSTSRTQPQAESSVYPYPDPFILGKGTDWVDVLSQTGIYDGQYAQLYGGKGSTHYFASVGYNYNRGVVIGQDYNRYSTRMSFDTKPAQWMTIGFNFSLTYFDVRRTDAKVSGTDTNAAIFISPILGTDSIWNKYSFDDEQGVVFNNPYIRANKVLHTANKWSFNLAPWLRIIFNPYLMLNTRLSLTRENNLSYYYSPSTMPVAKVRVMGGTASRSVYDDVKTLSETTLNYKRHIRKHDIEALAGFTGSKRVWDNSYIRGDGYINDSSMYYDMTGIMNTANYYANSYNLVKTTMSVLGRVNYSYDRRYYLTLTARADGASNFSASNKWGFFPAAAFRWSIMNEPWMRRAHSINDLSLRLSIGRSGNDAIASYLSTANISANKGSWLFNGKYLLTTLPNHLANSNLTWETTDALDLGFSFSAWRSRFTAELDLYLSRTSDLLLSVRNSQVTGYDSYFDNLGLTQNMGVELTLSTKNIRKRKFNWNTSFTISHNMQTVLDSGAGNEVVPTYMNPRNSTQYLYGYKTGYPVNALWGYQCAGVWHNEEEIKRNSYTHTYVSTIADGSNQSNVGRTKYVDVNGDGFLDQNDIVYMGNSDPILYGGLMNDFTLWGNLNLSAFFAYSIGGKIYNLSELYLGSSCRSWNKYRYVLDAWDEVRNPDSDQAKPGWDDNMGSNRQIHDASFLRLKTVTISYKINLAKWSKVLRSMTVGFTGENLWLLKSYNGFDPDVSTSSTVRRLDDGSFPRPRTFTFNFRLDF